MYRKAGATATDYDKLDAQKERPLHLAGKFTNISCILLIIQRYSGPNECIPPIIQSILHQHNHVDSHESQYLQSHFLSFCRMVGFYDRTPLVL
jgi:hypothetical protein